MLGIQQTLSAVPHHTTSHSPATAAAAVAAISGPIRTPPKGKRQISFVQKQPSDTVSPTQEEHEPLAAVDTIANETSAWLDVPQEQCGENHEGEVTGEAGQEEAREDVSKPALDGVFEDPQQTGKEANEQNRVEGDRGVTNEANNGEIYARRPSSPLSELSPAPDDDDSPNQEGGGEGEGATQDARVKGQPPSGAQVSDPANLIDANATDLNSGYPRIIGSGLKHSMPAAPFNADQNSIDGLPPSSPLPGSSSQLPHATSTPHTSSPLKPAGENAQAGPSGLTASSPTKIGTTQKFAILLEINALLFKTCEAFFAAGCVLQTQEVHPFASKLSSNLTWLSAHVDGVKLVSEIPEMDPPVLAPSAAHITFPDGLLDRINNLYSRLPIVFAKDIAWRNQRIASSSGSGTPTPIGHRNSSTPSLLPPSGIGVKRERPDSAGYSGYESPTAAKRRDTGDAKAATPSTPVQPGSAGAMDMPPPVTPMSSQSHGQMARPGSSMSGVGPLSGGIQASNSADGMFHPNASPGVGMGAGMQGMAGMGGLSPEAQARARQQMQMRQMQAMMHAQSQQQAHQQSAPTGQQHSTMRQGGMQSGNPSMSPPQRQSQPTPSPSQQQQMMQAQAAARQMSPPGAVPGMNMNSNMGMGMNGTDGMSPNQQGGMNSNMSQPGMNMNMNMNGMGSNTGSNMPLNPQVLASMGPQAMMAYQILQNPQHQMTQYLNQQMPGFSQLPMMDQIRRFSLLQQQRQMQQGQRNQQMISNQMMGNQVRPTNANASGSGTPQMQQLGQSSPMGMAPQMQSSNSEGGMQFPGTPTSANMNMPNRTASSMALSQQMGNMSGMAGMPNVPNMANLNPQQRQLYLMQMQMRGAGAGGSGGVGGGMNPSMMNPQMLAAAQERQRLEQQQRLAMAQRQGSPLNPTANSGRDQFPPGLRSNPTPSIGISRTGRSPSLSGMGDMAGGATPRIGGRMLPGNEDYQRQVLLQQAQRTQMQQQQHQQQQGFMQGQGHGQGTWAGQQTPQQQLPLSAGAWPQQNPQSFGIGGSPSGMQSMDLMGTPQQTNSTPVQMGQHSPTGPSSDFDNMMNW